MIERPSRSFSPGAAKRDEIPFAERQRLADGIGVEPLLAEERYVPDAPFLRAERIPGQEQEPCKGARDEPIVTGHVALQNDLAMESTRQRVRGASRPRRVKANRTHSTSRRSQGPFASYRLARRNAGARRRLASTNPTASRSVIALPRFWW